MRRGPALLLVALPVAALAAAGNSWVQLPGGSFRSALKYEDVRKVQVAPGELQRRPVTNADCRDFGRVHPERGRDRVGRVRGDARELRHGGGSEGLVDEAQ